MPKGKTNNPNGRPPKARELTEILKRAGAKTLAVQQYNASGLKKVSRKRWLADQIWQCAATGKVTFVDENGAERTLEVENIDSWLVLIKWLYTHIDGPAPIQAGVEGDLVIRLDGLDRILDRAYGEENSSDPG